MKQSAQILHLQRLSGFSKDYLSRLDPEQLNFMHDMYTNHEDIRKFKEPSVEEQDRRIRHDDPKAYENLILRHEGLANNANHITKMKEWGPTDRMRWKYAEKKIVVVGSPELKPYPGTTTYVLVSGLEPFFQELLRRAMMGDGSAMKKISLGYGPPVKEWLHANKIRDKNLRLRIISPIQNSTEVLRITFPAGAGVKTGAYHVKSIVVPNLKGL